MGGQGVGARECESEHELWQKEAWSVQAQGSCWRWVQPSQQRVTVAPLGEGASLSQALSRPASKVVSLFLARTPEPSRQPTGR